MGLSPGSIVLLLHNWLRIYIVEESFLSSKG